MSDIIVPSKNITIGLILGVVALIVAAIIAYNLGMSNGLRKQVTVTPNNNLGTAYNTETGNNAGVPQNNTAYNNSTITKTESPEIKIGGEPIIVKGKTILTGTIFKITDNGMVLSVVGQTFNLVNKTSDTKVTTYNVAFTKSTKFTLYSTSITMPANGGTPQIKTSTQPITVSGLTEGQSVTLVTNDLVTAKVLTALEVRVTSAKK